jgi:peptidoglycan hydrolase-like protein with peptidoglycan-binding domain
MSMRLGEAQIQEGAGGPEVRRLQELLTGMGYNTGGIDGIWGPRTTEAVKTFQSRAGLTPDGIAGPLTWAAIKGETPAPAPATAPAPAPAIPFPSLPLSVWALGAVAAVGLILFSRRK